MSADSPAAVPGPAEPSATTPNGTARTAGSLSAIASMLAPVDPARPTFDLTPTNGSTTTPDSQSGPGMTPVTGASSAAFHTDTTTQQTTPGSTGQAQPKGVIRAWLLAGAARWAKGGGTANKRLDLAKARATANQVKETRQVSVNRSDGIPGKPSAGSAGGKQAPGKSPSNGAVKNTPVNKPAPQSSSGRPGPTGGTAGQGGAKGSGKTPTGTGTGTAGGSGTVKKPTAPAPGGAQGPGKPGAKGPSGNPGSAGGGKPAGPGPVPTTKKPDTNKPAETGKPNGPTQTGTSPKPGTPNAAKGTEKPQGTTPSAKNNPASKDTPKPAPGNAPTQTGKPQTARDTNTRGKAIDTRESREAGYRDGTRAALGAAHVRAWRDGVKDGWTDTTEAAARDKARLDKAHQDRKTTRQPDKEQPVPPPTSTTSDVQPIEVRDVTATHVLLGDGAARDTMSRGEVRSLKNFERRLQEKADRMAYIAEHTKALVQHAEDQAAKATLYLEQAKAVHAKHAGTAQGRQDVAALAKLAEAAKVQVSKAEDIRRTAVRAAESCRVVLTNAQTRYGGIYQAVVDSPLTTPNELDFYRK